MKSGEIRRSSKSGQIQISFGMIFSILLIIAIVAVAIYVLVFFVSFGKCANIGLFYEELDNTVEKAWVSDFSEQTASFAIPSSVDFVCFGNLSVGVLPGSRDKYEELKFYSDNSKNVFLYPQNTGCDGNLASFGLAHTRNRKLFCEEVVNGEVNVKIIKESAEPLVRICPSEGVCLE